MAKSTTGKVNRFIGKVTKWTQDFNNALRAAKKNISNNSQEIDQLLKVRNDDLNDLRKAIRDLEKATATQAGTDRDIERLEKENNDLKRRILALADRVGQLEDKQFGIDTGGVPEPDLEDINDE